MKNEHFRLFTLCSMYAAHFMALTIFIKIYLFFSMLKNNDMGSAVI